MQPNYDHLFKVVMLGAYGSGKSSILMRYIYNEYTDDMHWNLGVDFLNKFIEIDGKKIKLQIWNPVGMERFNHVRVSTYKKTNVIILNFSISDETTFEAIHKLMN